MQKAIRFLFLCLACLGCLVQVDAGAARAQVSPAGDLDIAAAAGTAFYFQGSLTFNGAAYTGACDFEFALYGQSVGGQALGSLNTRTSVQVAGGQFTVSLDFGDYFNANERWLETRVRCGGGGGLYTTLNPRQRILPAPQAVYAHGAQEAVTAMGASGDFVVTDGVIKSSVAPAGEDMGGSLQLENSTSRNLWNLGIRSVEDDRLAIDAWDTARGSWRYGMRLDFDSNMTIEGTFTSGGVRTKDVVANGVLESARNSDGTNAGSLVLRNLSSGNVWNIPIRAEWGDSLDFHFWDAAAEQWRRPLRILSNGTLIVKKAATGSDTLLELQHDNVDILFHVDPISHPEIGLRDPADNSYIWNILDIDPVSGHIGLGNSGVASDRLKVYGNFSATGTKAATVDTGNYGLRKFYATEAADVRFSDEGIGQLVDGMAEITLDPILVAAISQPYIIQLTPYMDAGLYVAEIQPDHFVVKAREGVQTGQFAWRLSAPRLGYENVRLEEVEATPEELAGEEATEEEAP